MVKKRLSLRGLTLKKGEEKVRENCGGGVLHVFLHQQAGYHNLILLGSITYKIHCKELLLNCNGALPVV